MLTAEEIAEADELRKSRPLQPRPDTMFDWRADVQDAVIAFWLYLPDRAEDRSEFASRCGYHAAPTVH